MRVLRVYHAGRDPGHRRRERALVAAGADVVLALPDAWPDHGSEQTLGPEGFEMIELPVRNAGSVNAHVYAGRAGRRGNPGSGGDPAALADLIRDVRPDVVDLHEEPFSLAAGQWLAAVRAAARPGQAPPPVVMYTAQNLDKRYPPPFAQLERAAHRRVAGLYPCSRQAASVARGKGFRGVIEVLPLGLDPADFAPGRQRADDPEVTLGLVGRMVPEKGVLDAVRVLSVLNAERPARLHLVGDGPEIPPALALADRLGLADRVRVSPWRGVAETAAAYAAMHVLLVPSRSTPSWVEQFGRVITEGAASGAVVAGYAAGAIGEVAGDAGLLVPEGDVRALADGVTHLLAHPGAWAARRSAGLTLAAGCTWAAVAARQLALYEKVLAGGPVGVSTGFPAGSPACRAAARDEFGPPARTPVAQRPVALPVVRSSPRLTAAAGAVVDTVTAARRRLSGT